MKISKALGALLLAVLLVSLPCQAAEGNQGYAVYRDGVAMNLTWHAGIMVEPNSSNYGSAIAHAPGGSERSGYTTYEKFLNGHTYKGVYKPLTAMSSHDRDLVVATARYIANRHINYKLDGMIEATDRGQTRFVPSDITAIRCDGVVEYCYEYNGFPIYGAGYWDISKNDADTQAAHDTMLFINPQIQAQSYMQRISTTKP